jgi:hypothetical protein
MKNKHLFPRLRLLACLVPWLVAAPIFAQTDGNPPGRAARLSVIEGKVSFQPSGENDWSDATLNYTMTSGDRIYTYDGSQAELEVGPWAVRLAQDTDVTMANLTDQFMQLGVGQGSVRVAVYQMPPGNSVEIATPNGALTASVPGSYRVDVDPNNGTRVIVNRGSLQVSGGGANQTIEAGQAAQLTGTGPIQVTLVPLPAPDDFDAWCSKRDQRVEAFRYRQYVNPYVPGVYDLGDYGAWSQVPEYGPVWYPSGVAVGWVPYRFGYWAWVRPWGWTWVGAEPWGFCPYHFGRWAFIGNRWGWVPGPVAVVPWYAPALVAFVGGGGFSLSIGFGSGGVAAWFPLGPSDPFIPWYHYGGNYIRQINITNVRNVTNITNITNITNVNNIHYAYRDIATTAVPANVFRSGQSVASAAVRVTPQQLAQAQVIAHPEINPARTAVFAGKPTVQAPPVRTARVTPPSAGPAPQARPVQSSPPPTRPVPETRPVQSTPPPASPVPQTRPAPESHAPPPGGHPPGGPPAGRPTFITRTPPPPRDVPFSVREPALQQHPGRPLEPQQEENLRQGRPAGPPRDKEVLPHPAPPKQEARPEEKAPPPKGKPEAH